MGTEHLAPSYESKVTSRQLDMFGALSMSIEKFHEVFALEVAEISKRREKYQQGDPYAGTLRRASAHLSLLLKHL
jgi:hypothetical protein